MTKRVRTINTTSHYDGWSGENGHWEEFLTHRALSMTLEFSLTNAEVPPWHWVADQTNRPPEQLIQKHIVRFPDHWAKKSSVWRSNPQLWYADSSENWFAGIPMWSHKLETVFHESCGLKCWVWMWSAASKLNRHSTVLKQWCCPMQQQTVEFIRIIFWNHKVFCCVTKDGQVKIVSIS